MDTVVDTTEYLPNQILQSLLQVPSTKSLAKSFHIGVCHEANTKVCANVISRMMVCPVYDLKKCLSAI